MEKFSQSQGSIKTWASDDRPREKMLLKGASSLSNSELLAILINNGSKTRSALDLAKEILLLGANNLNELGKLSIHDFQKVKGIGNAKAITIAAALELGRRRHSEEILQRIKINNSKEIAVYLKTILKDFNYEVFVALFLNRSHKIISYEIISKGGISGTVADPRIILKKALDAGASSLIICHNHPSGNLQPSQQDDLLTQKIKSAALYFDIKLLDHIIVSEEGYYSFADEGKL
ncbi:MAG: DNA repair protein RadC [Chitinophagaceae bacterium]|jgi:DNA repair protein RadC|nr:DNA repair protein RadC [Chitinophagaceae bacterium]MBP6046563.1 DNA repair protein RadC [Ferruginibacter sp.]MBK8929267.1 DNA repair protein RadC [Chitinophagaceae bacterium]MBP6371001.1 DNA repair protein RadC [Ferruginibacter sp.]MBP6988391.1 DNA repair protein RadC [Ferruginibacter sp.]